MTRTNTLRLLKVSFVSILIALCGCGGVNSGGAGGGNTNTGASQAIIAFGVQPGNIIAGQSATLSWQVTNAASFAISPAVGTGTLPMTGSASVSPTATTTYVATATDSQGRSTSSSVIVNVVAAGSAPAITLSAQPPVVSLGQTTTLTWASTNALSVTITPSILTEDQTSLALSGSAPIVPNGNITYTAKAIGANGVTATTTTTVGLLGVTLAATPARVGPGQSTTLSWTSTNAASVSIDQGVSPISGASGSVTVSPSATTIYTITATNGTSTATATATVTAPLGVTMTANPVNIAPGGQSTLTWVSTGSNSLSIDNGVGIVTGTTSHVVTPTQNTTYTITASDASGATTTASATVNVVTNAGLQGIKHVIVMLQENRSFDNYFSKLGDYVTANHPEIANYQVNAGYNPNIMVPLLDGTLAHPFHAQTTRTENLSPAWDESHFDMHQQSDGTFLMDRFALTTNSVSHAFDTNKGLRALGYYDDTDLPYYYELATQFATSDSFHSGLLANTQPNRQYAFCATTQGRIFPSPGGHDPWTCPTIFSSLQNAGVNWIYYNKDGIVLANFADYVNNPAIQGRANHNISEYFATLASPTADQDLPSFVWIDSGSGGSGLDEHPDNNVQKGAADVKTIIDALMKSPAWADSIFILAYDEGGGLYDHVPPFTVVAPDDIPPQLGPTDLPGDFTLSGFRVPIVVVSPFVKPHFVSHTNREITSILKLIETRFSLPALTRRDAAADDMTEFFDFVNPPAFLTPPVLPAQPVTGVDDPSQEAPPQ
jgi:phospholipase C